MSRRRQPETSPLLPILALLGVGFGAVYVIRREKPAIQRLTRGLPSLPKSLPPWWSLPAFLSPFAPAAVAIHKGMKMGYSAVMQSAQQKLNDLGYGPIALTGEQDAATHQAAVAFQRAKGLVADGVIGPQTLGALGIVPPVPTQVPWKSYQPSLDEAAQALSSAYQAVTGSAPSTAILTLLMAQTSFETRPSGKTTGWNLPNFNWGGIKASAWDALYQIFPSAEGYGASQVTFPQKFAAYPSLEDGAEAYIRTLKGRSTWWNGLQSGTPQGLLQGLTTPPKYFTGDPVSYLGGIRGLAAQYAGTAARYAV